ncbi:HD domain-containing protein [Desulfarculales bacterium]
MTEIGFPSRGAGPPLPDLDEITRLWDTHAMLTNIRRHSEVVCAVALLLQRWLEQAGLCLDRQAIRAGALLHDLAKTPCLGSSRRHDLEGASLLSQLGYSQLGSMVQNHVTLPPDNLLDETMVVYYADKRVNHDSLVNLNQRYAYIASHYGKGDPQLLARIEQGRKRALEVERLIFASMLQRHTPDEVTRRWQEMEPVWRED